MTLDIQDLEKQIQTQSDDLANQIRNNEDSLMRLKETFLKIQGAKEMLGIVKSQSSVDEEEKVPEESIELGAD